MKLCDVDPEGDDEKKHMDVVLDFRDSLILFTHL